MQKLLKHKFSLRLTLFLLVCLIVSILFNIFLIYQNLERNRVKRVVDGDSLELADGRRIRLLSLNAPERERCLYAEAREKLKELALNKRVRLADTVTDGYGRTLANVFVSKGIGNPLFINKIMLEEGLARFEYVTSPHYEELKETANKAKTDKTGIYSSLCRTETSNSADCLIKGNIREDDKVYNLPDCPNYNEVIIDEAFGDQWFCTEEEASSQGFRKAEGCK